MEKVGLYETSEIVFYMHPNKVIVCTKLQCFTITYEMYKYHVYLNKLKLAILAGRINNVAEIAEYSTYRLKWENCRRPV